MPTYVLICEECEAKWPEQILSMADRAALKCACGGDLTNDYGRMDSSNFQLKGHWPGKDLKMANDILKDQS